MKIKRSEQELAYLEKREREVGLRWWADSVYALEGCWLQADPPLMHLYLQPWHQMPPEES